MTGAAAIPMHIDQTRKTQDIKTTTIVSGHCLKEIGDRHLTLAVSPILRTVFQIGV